jgi:hypothetical protein
MSGLRHTRATGCERPHTNRPPAEHATAWGLRRSPEQVRNPPLMTGGTLQVARQASSRSVGGLRGGGSVRLTLSMRLIRRSPYESALTNAYASRASGGHLARQLAQCGRRDFSMPTRYAVATAAEGLDTGRNVDTSVHAGTGTRASAGKRAATSYGSR